MSGRLPPVLACPRKIGGFPFAGVAQMCRDGTPLPEDDEASTAQPLIANVYATVALFAGMSTDIDTPVAAVTSTLCASTQLAVTLECTRAETW
jgi:hypothetical protein